jgi:hypothetical protein
LRNARDVDNSAPTTDGQARQQFYPTDAAGTTNDPNLVVEHITVGSVTIYAGASDGYVTNSYCNESTAWASVRSTTSTATTVCDSQEFIKVRSDSADGAYQIYRGSLVFDTSVIPDNATITSATLNVYETDTNGENTSNIVLVSHSRATTSSLMSGDWHITNYGSTSYGSTTNPLATSTYTGISVNVNGISSISKTGYSVFGLLTSADFENTDPGSSRKEITFASADASGTSTDPYIEITYITD